MWPGSPGCRSRRSRACSTRARTCARIRASACSKPSAGSGTGRTGSPARSSPAARGRSGCRRSTPRRVGPPPPPLFGPASTLLAIERAAHDAGYSVSIAGLRALDAGTLLGAVERLREQGVDGVLVIAPQGSAAGGLLQLAAHDIPVVATEAGPAGGVPLVAVDQVAGARLATEHLLALGPRTVSHVAGAAHRPEG